ncbi:MAG: hypothetical protein CSA26_01265 [Desulfobacterales bacterium]|nr:MAG: hypothetical protein CSA26_01265 [Desulfobacterales bacterium]
MTSNSYIIFSSEALVFRDGRPFGDNAQLHGGLLRWPHPGTVLGMFRSHIGFARGDDYFTCKNNKENIEKIKNIGLQRMIPMWQEEGSKAWKLLFPAPADVMITLDKQNKKKLVLNPLSYNTLKKGEGVNLPWKNWLLPFSNIKEKPVKEPPTLWHEEQFLSWLEKGEKQSLPAEELGLFWPDEEYRLHTAVDNKARTVLDGQLFSSRGIRLEAKTEKDCLGRYGIGVDLEGLEVNDNPEGTYFLGGDRKIAHIKRLATRFPPLPSWTKDSARYLRLVLITPGNFGDWAPSWLIPNREEPLINWKTFPGSTLQLRLVSAIIQRWQPVSGWDMENRKPKATTRLVPAGSIYIVELKEPKKAPELAERLWGNTLAITSKADGYGCVCIGKQMV